MLSATDLSCVRGGRPLFSGVGLRIGAGEWLHVRGANGAGKTSLLRILAGLSAPAAGQISWNDVPLARAGEDYRRAMVYLGHAPAIKDDLTASENLAFMQAQDEVTLSEAERLAILVRVGLRHRLQVPVRHLSAGQRRRVSLARLLLRRAPLWILDEPFTALDVDAVAWLGGVVAEHVRAGGCAVLTSHQDIPLPAGRTLQL